MSASHTNDESRAPSDGAIHLPAATPYNLEATVRLLQRRPSNRIDLWDERRYLRVLQTADGLRLVAVENRGTVDAPALRMEIRGGSVAEDIARELSARIRWILGLDAVPAPALWLAEREPRLAPVVAAVRGFRPPCFPALFETCARVVPFQQLSIDAGTAIVGRLVERFGPALTIDGRQWVAFPSPEAITDARPDLLRETGLSRAKVASLQALARLALDGGLDSEHFQALSMDDALAELRSLPGLGPWSAGLILLRGLRRMDIFPPGDIGAARNLAALLDLPAPLSPAEASAFATRFGEQQGYLYFLGLASQFLRRGMTLGGG